MLTIIFKLLKLNEFLNFDITNFHSFLCETSISDFLKKKGAIKKNKSSIRIHERINPDPLATSSDPDPDPSRNTTIY
jgi:hypothetical protein